MAEPPAAVDPSDKPFPIVAIGASAGGLLALRQLFESLTPEPGMAFVVIQHLDPGRPSMLSDVLDRAIRMPVAEARHGAPVEPNHVYVIPPSSDLSIEQGRLVLVARQPQGQQLHLPIDAFFRALAEDSPRRAIGVVLSGAASDGTDGLRAIRAAGGITFAQEPDSAQFRSMPESAIAAGVVDFRGTPAAIADELVRLGHHAYLTAEGAPSEDEDSLANILGAIRRHTQLDFRGYKKPTLFRRIARRAALRGFDPLDAYARALLEDPAESRALADDILIQVTSFFRDPEAFDALDRLVLSEILGRKQEGTVRVWVPGCSTGEELYSVAILLLERFAREGRGPAIQVFGSDLSAQAIQTARVGVYSESDVEGVSPERRARFFERAEGRFRIAKVVRDRCVFVRHDLTRDPPFARLDLICCRNVLIYFSAELQQRVLPLLHFCLNKPGYLFLGSSEAIRDLDDLFEPVDKTHRIYRKIGESPRVDYPLAVGHEVESVLSVFQPTARAHPSRHAQRQADHILLARYAPPGVVVDERLNVVQFRGRTGDFLEPPPGRPDTNLLRMAREGLVAPLREALEAASARSVTVRIARVEVSDGANTRFIQLEVVPLPTAGQGADRYFLVVFEEADTQVATQASSPADRQGDAVPHLKAQLAATTSYLQAITGEHQDITEELGAANEELIAANEELQSTNEELQSAKEELQSMNEELTTLNDELVNKNQELDQLASDLVNVLESVQIPVIMVDESLRIRRFTPTARDISSMHPNDVGRSIDDVKIRVEVDDLVGRLRATMESQTPSAFDVRGLDGRWFKLHMRPYRTADQRLAGAILVFLDVDVLKRALQDAERARDYAQGIVQAVPMSLVVIDAHLRIATANQPFHRSFGEGASGRPQLVDFAEGVFDQPMLRQTIEASLVTHDPFRSLDVRAMVPARGQRDLVVSGSPIWGTHNELMLLLAIEDITERRLLEASERQSRVDAEQANRAKDLFLATLSHELRTPLNTILMSAQVLQRVSTDDPRIDRASALIERAAGNQARLIDDLLDISRIVSGKLVLDLQAVDLVSVVHMAVDVVQSSAESKGIRLELKAPAALPPLHGDSGRLQQVVGNLLNNAIKFTPRGGSITVCLEAIEDRARITVRDTGVGVPAALVPHLFDRFVQAESAMTRSHGGLGLGLAIVRHLVEVHGGDVSVESPGEGHGSTFTVTLPIARQGQAALAGPGPTVSRSIDGVRVLVVEDDDDTRDACRLMLELQGAAVRVSSSAAEALDQVTQFHPQVILCDIAMPGEDGYSFVRALRRTDLGKTIPAAALTALASESDRGRALDAGFQMHLAKPIDADRLATAVATLEAWPVEQLVDGGQHGSMR